MSDNETTTTITTAATFDQLYAALVDAAATPSTPPADSFSVAQFADDAGIHWNTARRVLIAQEKAGKLESAVFLVDGNRTRFYWFVEV